MTPRHYKLFQNPIRAHFADFCLKALSDAERLNLELSEGFSPSSQDLASEVSDLQKPQASDEGGFEMPSNINACRHLNTDRQEAPHSMPSLNWKWDGYLF